MISLILGRFFILFGITMPFLTLSVMLLALWGIGGKATYAELNTGKPMTELSAGQVKPVLMPDSKSGVCDAKTIEAVIDTPNSDQSEKKITQEKIDWSKVV